MPSDWAHGASFLKRTRRTRSQTSANEANRNPIRPNRNPIRPNEIPYGRTKSSFGPKKSEPKNPNQKNPNGRELQAVSASYRLFPRVTGHFRELQISYGFVFRSDGFVRMVSRFVRIRKMCLSMDWILFADDWDLGIVLDSFDRVSMDEHRCSQIKGTGTVCRTSPATTTRTSEIVHKSSKRTPQKFGTVSVCS